jgi:MoxR-like ATPase
MNSTSPNLAVTTEVNNVADSAIQKLSKLRSSLHNNLVGNKNLVDSMLICLLCDGHLLIEGMPGLAKTLAAKTLAKGIEGDFHRIQFTPDLLPADLIGSDILNPASQSFSFNKGPIFQNIVLADEVNRAPAKVQSALLEAMEEKQVTVGQKTYELPKLFMVLATQNPIEQEGTYTLPEAHIDRFFMHVLINYPEHDEEIAILNLHEQRSNRNSLLNIEVTSQEEIFAARAAVKQIFVDDKLKNYIVSLVRATRSPEKYHLEIAKLLRFGASPRATIALLSAAKAYAWLLGNDYVAPEHIQFVAANILRHRIMPSFEAIADGKSADHIISELLKLVAIP